MGYLKGFLFGVVSCLIATAVWAGQIDSPAGPTEEGSAMYTITDVYNRINNGTAGTKRTTTYGEPTAAPGSTGKTLNELYDLASERSRPAKTGQTTSYATGDDGGLKKGVSWPSTRFTDNSNGTVTDNLTGLVWLKAANYNNTTGTTGTASWANALSFCNALQNGQCGLTDGSVSGDWRLPNYMELVSLLDLGYDNPALSNAAGTGQWSEGNAFTGVQSYYYWSSTTCAAITDYAWFVGLGNGYVVYDAKTYTLYVWPVRGGQ